MGKQPDHRLVATDAFLEGVQILAARDRGDCHVDDSTMSDLARALLPLKPENNYEAYPTAKVRKSVLEIGAKLAVWVSQHHLDPGPIETYLDNGLKPEHAQAARSRATTLLHLLESNGGESGNRASDATPFATDATKQKKIRAASTDLRKCSSEFLRERENDPSLRKTQFIRDYAELNDLRASTLIRASNDHPELFLPRDTSRRKQRR